MKEVVPAVMAKPEDDLDPLWRDLDWYVGRLIHPHSSTNHPLPTPCTTCNGSECRGLVFGTLCPVPGTQKLTATKHQGYWADASDGMGRHRSQESLSLPEVVTKALLNIEIRSLRRSALLSRSITLVPSS